VFDIETTPQKLPQKHVLAVRITSENAGDGFKPTAGRVDEVGGGDVPSQGSAAF
jgi:acetyl-CoA carboxylase/biotin carboxylase 1